MNQIIAGIYGTGGHEKVASEGGETVATLSDLAVLMTAEFGVDTSDLEKVASVHQSVLGDLISFDRSGRAMAHHEFSQMEAEAANGNAAALEAFFADQAALEKEASIKQAIHQEMARRGML